MFPIGPEPDWLNSTSIVPPFVRVLLSTFLCSKTMNRPKTTLEESDPCYRTSTVYRFVTSKTPVSILKKSSVVPVERPLLPLSVEPVGEALDGKTGSKVGHTRWGA